MCLRGLKGCAGGKMADEEKKFLTIHYSSSSVIVLYKGTLVGCGDIECPQH